MFAAAPDIVQPVSATFDRDGRLLVIENHTHFRPDDYLGPPTDRIRLVADRDGDGRADSFETWFEGARDCMDLARHPDGSIYLATRRKIVRLGNVAGEAGEPRMIVQLETEGKYPHNGLSGLFFDHGGNVGFGFGENLGADYTLIGSDGAKLSGGAEGGSTYRCTSKGEDLERVSTGFWNPFGQCIDPFGNVFAVDNDPDATPPCRLLHVFDGANFGYQFRYGRPGTHPLQTWTGELPGTAGMIAGTGEAPCEVVCYLGDGLPKDYVGDLLVASWGDHRIERFLLKRTGATFEAERKIIIQGDASFWPVGIAVAPNGSLYITDWGSRSYPLHGEGRIWHVATSSEKADSAIEAMPESPRYQNGAVSKAQKLARSAKDPTAVPFAKTIASSANTDDLRAQAVRVLGKHKVNVQQFTARTMPVAVRSAALETLETSDAAPIADALRSDDLVFNSTGVRALIRNRKRLNVDWFSSEFLSRPSGDMSEVAVGVALACETSNDAQLQSLIPSMLESTEERVRVVAARWIADRMLARFRTQLESAVSLPTNNFRVTMALLAAQRHLDGEKPGEGMTDVLVGILDDASQSPSTKRMAIRAAKTESLPVETFSHLLEANDKELVRETIFALRSDPRPAARRALMTFVSDDQHATALRADALVAMDVLDHDVKRLVWFASRDSDALSSTALRLLTGDKLTESQRAMFDGVSAANDSALARLLEEGAPVKNGRSMANVAEWLEKLAAMTGAGDAQRGRRLFFNTRLLQCANCHTVANRGASIGPDLTGIAGTQKLESLIRSIVDPSERIAPQYQPWMIVDSQGKTQAGYHLHTKNLVDIYVDSGGKQFRVAHDEIEQRIALDKSIMPDGLIDGLDAGELRDLIAFLSE